MKTDPADIDKQALRQLLKDAYGLEVVTLTFVPMGEESYCYIAEASAARRYFVKVHTEMRPPDLGIRYEAANRLHTQCGLDFVVHPHETRQGRFLCEFGKYAVAVFDYVEGKKVDPSLLTDEDCVQTAVLTASLHASMRCPSLPPLRREQFEVTYKDWLLEVLAAAKDTNPAANRLQYQARELLISAEDDVLATLARLERLAEQVRTIECELHLTHGDLQPSNFVIDSQGNLHLIDWGKIALTPPERDLINFIGERFELFVTSYLRAFERRPELHEKIFEYYIYFYRLGGIADYGSWILLEDAELQEKTRAWEQLKTHLPIKNQRVQATLNEVARVVEHACGGS